MEDSKKIRKSGVKHDPTEFAPLNIPFRQRLQTLAVTCFYFMVLFLFYAIPYFSLFLFIYIVFFTSYWWLWALYLVFYVYDYLSPCTGGWSKFSVSGRMHEKQMKDSKNIRKSGVKDDPTDFASLNIPFRQRLQTLAVTYFYFMAFSLLHAFPYFSLFLFIYIVFFTSYWWLSALYLVFYMYDYQSPSTGGWSNDFVRHMIPLSDWCTDYFPVKLIKTAELDSNQNYLLGYHPHGTIPFGASSLYKSAISAFSGLKIHVATVQAIFNFPLVREAFLSYGLIACSRGSMEYVLSSKEKGKAVTLVVGGIEEALVAHRGKPTVLILQKRKGFIKVALRTGAHLVPVFSFGQNESYAQMDSPEGSRRRTFQNIFKKMTGLPPFIAYGRGVSSNSFGFFPFRSPINVVVGKPIPVEKIEEPTEQQIDDLHSRYVIALKQLFEENKEQYGVSTDEKLIIN